MATPVTAPAQEDSGDTLGAQGIPLRDYPNWDQARQALLVRCGLSDVKLADVLNESRPDEASLQRWIESYPLPEALIGIEQQFSDEP
jgi:hypothetical protein